MIRTTFQLPLRNGRQMAFLYLPLALAVESLVMDSQPSLGLMREYWRWTTLLKLGTSLNHFLRKCVRLLVSRKEPLEKKQDPVHGRITRLQLVRGSEATSV